MTERLGSTLRFDASVFNVPTFYPTVAFAAGLGMALLVFPVALLFGLPSYWDFIQGDSAANWIGYEAFARDAWRWPLFNTELISPPAGVNIIFTDPIPLLALVGKLILKATGFLPNYFGLWLLLAYGLQPLSGYALLRALRLSRPAALAGGLLFLTVPAFIFRFGHYPLVSHWILVLALTLSVLIVRDGRRRDVILAVALVTTVVLINPYLLVMTAGILVAALGDAVLQRRIKPLAAGTAVLAMICGVGALTVCCGFVDPSAPPSSGWGFGHYSMNLLSPVIPQLSSWPGAAHFILEAIPGQYEGFNYLGLGILALLGLAAVLAWRPLLAFVWSRPVLFLAVTAMAVYALSDHVYAGSHLILRLPFERFRPFAMFAGIFRSSGRFFWPFTYFALAAACAALFTRLTTRRFVLLASALLAVQMVDILPVFAWVAAMGANKEWPISRSQMTELLREHDELILLPQFLCMADRDQEFGFTLGLISARLGLPTNSAIINRSGLQCAAEKAAYRQSLTSMATRPDPLVVVLKDEASPEVPRFAAVASGLTCRDGGFAYICSRHALTPAMAAVSVPLDLGATVVPGHSGVER